MRICSLLPGATEVVAALGLVDGVELLAALFHPQRFGHRLPDGARRV